MWANYSPSFQEWEDPIPLSGIKTGATQEHHSWLGTFYFQEMETVTTYLNARHTRHNGGRFMMQPSTRVRIMMPPSGWGTDYYACIIEGTPI